MLIYFVKPWNGGWRKGKTTLPRFHRWQFITTLHATLRILSTFVNVRFARQNGQFGSFICQLPKYILDKVEESKILDQGKIVKKFKELTKNNWESLDQYWSLNSYKKMIFEKSSYSFTELEKSGSAVAFSDSHHQSLHHEKNFSFKKGLEAKKSIECPWIEWPEVALENYVHFRPWVQNITRDHNVWKLPKKSHFNFYLGTYLINSHSHVLCDMHESWESFWNFSNTVLMMHGGICNRWLWILLI